MLKVDAPVVATSITDVASAAESAEGLGFSGLQTAEAAHDPYLPLMIAAEHSEKLELMTAIAVAFPRSPMITAYQAWDLQRYSNGRFVLGLGTQVKGHNERRFSIEWGRPGPRMRDVILSLRAIWDCWQTGGPLRYEGEFYRFSLMTPFFNPGPQQHPDIPIYVAGVNPYICRLAGELCDGFHIHPLHTVRYLEERVKPLIAEGAAAVGREPSACALAAPCFVVTGDDDEEISNAASMVRQQVAFYASTPAYAAVLETHGWGDIGPKLTEASKRGQWGEMANLINDDILAEVAVIGKRDQIAQLLKNKYDGLVDRISLYLPFVPGTDHDWWQDIVSRVA